VLKNIKNIKETQEKFEELRRKEEEI